MDHLKAFDRMGHNLLCYKLKVYGVRIKINGWIIGSLVSEEISSYVSIVSGVSQGSAISPALFLFYIKNVPEGLSSISRLFADNTILYLIVNSPVLGQPSILIYRVWNCH